jgi:hypothetical protein
MGVSNPNYPTNFLRPFRSSSGSVLTPIPFSPSQPEIESTLLRSDSPTAPNTTSEPLLSFDTNTASANIGDWNQPDRNPYFRYQGLQRLGNLTTTRSNVYSVWITVGYFEVTPWGTVDVGHPDGYQLGQELGSDTGEIERHRAFYMFDRSIPVGFQRGQDLNVEKAILLKRFIE